MLSSSETSVQITNALEKLIDSGISLGERVLGALIIFIVGKFLVNWLNRLFARILEKRKVDPSIQSFLKSMVNILLLIMLILAVIGKLGIELTGFAALLASAGVARLRYGTVGQLAKLCRRLDYPAIQTLQSGRLY